MIYIVICISAFLVSGLPLFSGFGLGTLLMPAFALFFPVHVAVAATAVVHGANNIFKIFVVGRNADRDLVLRFGISAIMAAFAGVMIGKRWMHKVTMNAIQWITGFLLLAIALALGAGII